MNRSVVYKLGAIGLLIALLLIPLLRIDGLIKERQALRDRVVQDIARSSAYSQRITGPLLIVPYRKTVREWKQHSPGDERYIEEHEISGHLYFLPETFKLDGRVQTEQRARGIYRARLYHSNNKISGYFYLPAQLGLGADATDYRFDPAYLALGISDIRGIENALTLTLNDQTLKFQPGSGAGLLGSGVHAPLSQSNFAATTRLNFSFELKLQGTSQFDIAPVGRETEVSLTSDWPHPSFVGDYLPLEQNVDTKGFNARWQTSFFSTNLEEALETCAGKSTCDEFNNRRFGVNFIDPVDQYLKSDRAIKYALLFIALTFAGFFLFEVLKKLAVHPVQYGLVGMALAVFYLLLLSLSEHIGFALAYLLSSLACVALIGFYVGHALQSVGRGIGFAGGLAVLYAMLYGLLSAEDYALLMGSLLLFGLLGVVMVLTRNVNWFNSANRESVA